MARGRRFFRSTALIAYVLTRIVKVSRDFGSLQSSFFHFFATVSQSDRQTVCWPIYLRRQRRKLSYMARNCKQRVYMYKAVEEIGWFTATFSYFLGNGRIRVFFSSSRIKLKAIKQPNSLSASVAICCLSKRARSEQLEQQHLTD